MQVSSCRVSSYDLLLTVLSCTALYCTVLFSCDLVLCRDADQRLVLVAGRTGAHTVTCTPAQLHYTPATRGVTIQVTHVSHVAQCDT